MINPIFYFLQNFWSSQKKLPRSSFTHIFFWKILHFYQPLQNKIRKENNYHHWRKLGKKPIPFFRFPKIPTQKNFFSKKEITNPQFI
jgi:hypothetical protein